jgi:hypothetical protein
MIESFLQKLTSNSETKPFYTTSEFWVWVGTTTALATEVVPTHNTQLKATLIAASAWAYKIARGLAKAGVKPS